MTVNGAEIGPANPGDHRGPGLAISMGRPANSRSARVRSATPAGPHRARPLDRPLPAQAVVLRALQTAGVVRLGGNDPASRTYVEPWSTARRQLLAGLFRHLISGGGRCVVGSPRRAHFASRRAGLLSRLSLPCWAGRRCDRCTEIHERGSDHERAGAPGAAGPVPGSVPLA
jgi:hypothetical protein